MEPAKGRGLDGGSQLLARAQVQFSDGIVDHLGNQALAVAVEFDANPVVDLKQTLDASGQQVAGAAGFGVTFEQGDVL